MSKKNILLLFPDQLRADFCGCYGADWLSTPNIDALASEGVRYREAVTPSPACVPARASLLTGKSALANRVIDNSMWLRPDHKAMDILTWPQQLVEAGYHTAAIGKMHFYPWDISEGFQHRVIAEDKRHIEIQDDYTLYLKKHGYNRYHGSEHEGYYENQGAIISKIPEEHQIDRYVADEACAYIKSMDKDRPFAMMVGFPGPHGPYDPSEDKLDRVPKGPMPASIPETATTVKFKAKNHRDNSLPWNGVDLSTFTETQKQNVRRHYSALVMAIDDYVGEIIQTLKDEGLYEDTIIIFTADHGDYLGDFNMAGKGHFYESSYKIPLIVRHPDREVMEIEHPVSLTDVYNTILNFAEIDIEETDDSTVLAPFGKGEKRSPVFGSNEMGWMYRDNRYLHTIYYNGVRELYDLENDREHQNNLIDSPEHQQLISSLQDKLFARVFGAISEGDTDNIAKFNNMKTTVGPDGFNYEGWKRPYPFSKKMVKKQ